MLRVLAAVFVTSALFGQEVAFERLKREAARAKALSSDTDRPKITGAVTALHLAMRDWIESRLPQAATSAELGSLEVVLQAELGEAGLTPPPDTADPDLGPGGPGLGYVDFEFKWLPELPDALFVIANVIVDCGSDDVVYMYRFDAGGRVRAFEDHPKGNWGHRDAGLELSDPDSQGRRLLLTRYMSSQCLSSWMMMAYSVYRLGLRRDASELLLSSEHGFWLNDDGPEIVLKPDELIFELLYFGVDADVLIRTHVHRYNFAEGVRRLDPVALQPQDFAEEWLTQSWSEMQSKSTAETKEWHERLHSDSVSAEYSKVVACVGRPGRWLIGLDFTQIGEKKLEEPLTAYFLVHDLGSYHYSMDAVSASMPPGCPGTGNPSAQHPWLTPAELKALR